MSAQAIGQAVRRGEDPCPVEGQGRYVDDVRLSGEARGHVQRSPHAYARIVTIDTWAGRSAPGVLIVLTDDLAERGLGTPRPFVPRKKRWVACH